MPRGTSASSTALATAAGALALGSKQERDDLKAMALVGVAEGIVKRPEDPSLIAESKLIWRQV